jgi:iron(III) transport system permease protein
VAAALGSPLLLFGILIVIGQKWILGDQTRFVTHGGKSFTSQARPSWLAAGAIATFGVVSTALPVGALVLVSVSPFWSGKIQTDLWTLDNFRRIFEQSGITDAVMLSVVASVTAVAIALPIGFAAASLLLRGRRNRVARTLVDFIISMPLGIPAVIFGAGFLLTYTKEPFVLYGTKWVIILVYVTLMLPFTTRMQLSGMVALGDSYVEASRTSGAGILRTNAKVILPLMRPTIAGTAALMFILLIHEFAASLLVRSPTTQVMGTVLYDYWTNGAYPLVAAIALIMALVTLVGVVLALAIGGSDILNKM